MEDILHLLRLVLYPIICRVLAPSQVVTPPKFNIAPEKWWLEDEFPFGIASF